MPKIVCYIPTFSPDTEAVVTRSYSRLPQSQIIAHLGNKEWRTKPAMYFDAIDSILNVRPDIKLVVADAKSTDSIRQELQYHHNEDGGYQLRLYPEKESQWKLFNDIYEEHKDYDYFVYSSSDIIWTMDWVSEAIKEFEKNQRLQILFPLVSEGDANIPCQAAPGPRDEDPIPPPYDQHGKAPVLNAYVMIFRMDFLREYGGYPNVYKNCYTESFLPYMCKAIGGEMRLLPRGWCWHWSLGDRWDNKGDFYNFNAENSKFHVMMNELHMISGAGLLTSDYLRKILYD